MLTVTVRSNIITRQPSMDHRSFIKITYNGLKRVGKEIIKFESWTKLFKTSTYHHTVLTKVVDNNPIHIFLYSFKPVSEVFSRKRGKVFCSFLSKIAAVLILLQSICKNHYTIYTKVVDNNLFTRSWENAKKPHFWHKIAYEKNFGFFGKNRALSLFYPVQKLRNP